MGQTARGNEADLAPSNFSVTLNQVRQLQKTQGPSKFFTDEGTISPISSLIVRRYMATLQTHGPASQVPASLRSNTPNRRANPGSLTEATRPYLIAGRKGRTPIVGRTAFIALPKESEDARITGATRSLDRRLLALNLKGSRMSVRTLTDEITEIRIA
jgi:hypothetical protein